MPFFMSLIFLLLALLEFCLASPHLHNRVSQAPHSPLMISTQPSLLTIATPPPFKPKRDVVDLTTTTTSATYTFAPGSCGIHVQQIRIANGALPHERFNIYMLDANLEKRGEVSGRNIDVTLPVENQYRAVIFDRLSSGLPGLMTVYTAGTADEQFKDVTDPAGLRFCYDADCWSSSDERCSVGAWDLEGGWLYWAGIAHERGREMDCRFAC